MDYYSKKIFLAKVDKEDRILGTIERWQAHKKGILHRGFTVILFWNDQMIIQQRKHPAFDGFWDLTFSSHPAYINDVLMRMEEAIDESLKREWHIEKKDLIAPPKFLGKIYYQAKDPNSVYSEHEIDYIFSGQLKKLPLLNPDFAYGFKLVKKTEIESLKSKINLAPWVKKILDKKLI